MTTTLPALTVQSLRCTPNSNGNSRDQMVGAMLKLRDAYGDVLKALTTVQTDTVHGRNYQTVSGPDYGLRGAIQRQDVELVRALQDHATSMANWAYDEACRLHETD